MPRSKTTPTALTLVVLCCAAMALVDALWRPVYPIKAAVKLVLFLLLPLLLLPRRELKALLRPQPSGLGRALALGLGVYALILGGFFLLRQVVDFSPIVPLLEKNVGVTGDNFLFVALYISFCNSLLEEFFFRGVAYLSLRDALGSKGAGAFSALAFALYHVAIMDGWFPPLLLALLVAGLALAGAFFNWLDSREGTLYPAWMVHAWANFAINTAGMILFRSAE